MRRWSLIIIVPLSFAFFSCNKESGRKWEVEASSIVPNGDHLVFSTDADFSETMPMELATGSSNLVWEEDQKSNGSFFHPNTFVKQIVIEIPDSTGITNFSYIDDEVYSKLKCVVYSRCDRKNDGYYRIRKGVVTGQKQNGVWSIDFRVVYGGKNGDKYRMVKDAAY